MIGRRVRNVTPAAAARYIFGYTAAQDITDRTIQTAESQWARCKSFDTFTPLGPYVETKIDPHDLTIQLFQNGQLRQNSNTSQLIFNCFDLVSFISTNMTLRAGRHHPHRHPQRHRPHRIGRPPGSPHPGSDPAGQYGQVGFWLEVLAELIVPQPGELQRLLHEADEVVAIVVTSRKNARS